MSLHGPAPVRLNYFFYWIRARRIRSKSDLFYLNQSKLFKFLKEVSSACFFFEWKPDFRDSEIRVSPDIFHPSVWINVYGRRRFTKANVSETSCSSASSFCTLTVLYSFVLSLIVVPKICGHFGGSLVFLPPPTCSYIVSMISSFPSVFIPLIKKSEPECVSAPTCSVSQGFAQ